MVDWREAYPCQLMHGTDRHGVTGLNSRKPLVFHGTRSVWSHRSTATLSLRTHWTLCFAGRLERRSGLAALQPSAQDSAPEGLETECGRMGRLATPIWAIPKEMTSNDNQSIPSTEEHKRQQHVNQQLC